MRRKYKKHNELIHKVEYNKLTAKLRLNLKEFRDKSWLNFIQNMGKNPLSSKPFWQKINKLKKIKAQKIYRI